MAPQLAVNNKLFKGNQQRSAHFRARDALRTGRIRVIDNVCPEIALKVLLAVRRSGERYEAVESFPEEVNHIFGKVVKDLPWALKESVFDTREPTFTLQNYPWPEDKVLYLKECRITMPLFTLPAECYQDADEIQTDLDDAMTLALPLIRHLDGAGWFAYPDYRVELPYGHTLPSWAEETFKARHVTIIEQP